MRNITKYSKLLLFLIDIATIAISAIVANLLLSQINYMFTINNLHTILNSVFVSIIIYEIYLNYFKVYRNITMFESGKDYFIYITACLLSGATLVGIRLLFKLDINSCRKEVLQSLITIMGILLVRVTIRFFLNSIYREKQDNNEKTSNVLIIGAGFAAKI